MSNFIKVYRGTHGDKWGRWPDNPETVIPEIGLHWTSDPIVAYHFARHGALSTQHMHHPDNLLPRELQPHFTGEHDVMQGNSYLLGSEHRPKRFELPKPVVFEGWAHKSSVVDPRSEEWDELSERHNIYSPDADEQQVTLRPGSRVHISKVHMLGPQFDVRSFGIPRSLKIRTHDEDEEEWQFGSRDRDV